MPYLGKTHTGNEAVRAEVAASPFLDVPECILRKAHDLRWSHSSFSDPGPDWNSVCIRDEKNNIIWVSGPIEGF